jgi:hypothetical protein
MASGLFVFGGDHLVAMHPLPVAAGKALCLQLSKRILTIANIRFSRLAVRYAKSIRGPGMKLPNNTAIAVALVAISLSVAAIIITIVKHA